MKKTIYWENFEIFKNKYVITYTKLSTEVENELNSRILNGDDYILSQEFANKLDYNHYQSHVNIPENIFKSYVGMELYSQIKQLGDWHYEETTLRGRDFAQTIYFKGVGNYGIKV